MIKKILDKFYLDKTFLKFAIVGVVNTLFGMAIMFAFYNLLGLNYWISSASNYIFGSILSYFLNKYFTFGNKNRSIKIVIKFIINISVCYLVAYGIAQPLISFAMSGFDEKIQDNVAMLVGMGLFVILNYFGQRFFAFKEENVDTEDNG